MVETFEGILVFDDPQKMEAAVQLLQSKDVLSNVFHYAVNLPQQLVVLPRANYPKLSEIKDELFEMVNPQQSHLDGILIEDDIVLMAWDVHTESFFELMGAEVAQMFDDEADKAYFELPTDALDGVSVEAFIKRRDELAMQAYHRLPGYIESIRIDRFFQDKEF